MKNRLEYIQRLLNEGVYSPGGDVAWLVAEVERLRNESGLEEYNVAVEGLVGDLMTDKVAGKLVEISDRLSDRKDPDAQDIDWLISQIALLRRRNDLLCEDVASLKKQLTDAQDVAAAMYRQLGAQRG
jgi:hypothetical protein